MKKPPGFADTLDLLAQAMGNVLRRFCGGRRGVGNTLGRLLVWSVLATLGAVGAKAQLVAPPGMSWSFPSSVQYGSTVTIDASAWINYSDNSDGNDWNTPNDLVIYRIMIQLMDPNGNVTQLSDWVPGGPIPNSASVSPSFTANIPGTWYVQFDAMDGRPWYYAGGNYSGWMPIQVQGVPTITPNASVSPASLSYGQSLTLTRDGSASLGIAWTENVIWPPSGGAENLGNFYSPNALGTMTYTPDRGPGAYSWQFRLVDNQQNYQDQFVTFTVTQATQSPVTITPATTSVAAGQSVTFTAGGGSGSGAYVWGGSASGNGTTNTVTFAAPGTPTVTVYKASDADYLQSNTATATISVSALSQTVTLAPGNLTNIAGQPITFTATGGQNGYIWGGSASGGGSTQQLTFSTPGTYTVSVYSPAGGNYAQSNVAASTVLVVVLVPSGSVSPASLVWGQSETLQRAGTASQGIAWTESVIWPPSGAAEVQGNNYAPNALGSASYTPDQGTGTYSWQFRLVDNNQNYVDQWITFNVTPAPVTFGVSASALPYTGSAQAPVITVTPSGATYSVSGTTSATAVGSYSFTATATGNYTGSSTVPWSIVKADQAPVTVTISPASPMIIVGQSITFTASGGSGSGEYIWGGAASGTGTSKTVTFNSSGSYIVTVSRAGDANYNPSAITPVTITVTLPAVPVINSSLAVADNQGESVTYQISATNSPTSFTATNLPPGLSLNLTSGVISGAPTAGGTYSSTITATNAYGTDTETLVWTITASQIVPMGSLSAGPYPVGQAVSLIRNATANFGIAWTESVIWPPTGPAQIQGNNYPPNALGTASYVPTQLGTYSWQLRIVDNYQNYVDQWLTFTVTPAPPPVPPAITSSGTASGTVGVAFTYQITATNNPTGYAATGLPAGLSLDPVAGTISGVPSSPGTTNISISATNAGGTGSATLVLTVAPSVPPPPAITSPGTASGMVGVAFTYQITATNNPTSYAATGLPAGLSLDAVAGTISGVPSGPGTTNISISVTNAGGTGSATLVLTVAPATSTVSASDYTLEPPPMAGEPLLGLNTSYELELDYNGNPPNPPPGSPNPFYPASTYQYPLYTPLNRDNQQWWNNLLDEMLFSRAQVALLFSRGYLDDSNTLVGDGNCSPYLLTSMNNAVSAAGASNLIKFACFIDTAAFPYTYVYVYPNAYPPNTTYTPFDLSNTAAWQEILWKRFVKPWFDTVPSNLWYRYAPPGVSPGRPAICIWGVTDDFVNFDGPNKNQPNVNAPYLHQMLESIEQNFINTYGEDPVFFLDKTWTDHDPQVATEPYLAAVDTWFNPPSTSYTFNSATDNAYGDNRPFGVAVPGYFAHDPKNPGGNFIDRNDGGTLAAALQAGQSQNAKFILLEGFENFLENAGYYRSNSWTYPNQYLNLIREAADRRTQTLRFQAEGCDKFNSNTPPASPPAFRSDGLDVIAITDEWGNSNFAVPLAAPGNWVEYRHVFLSAGNYRFTANASAASAQCDLQIQFNGQSLPAVSAPFAGDMNGYGTVSLGEKYLAQDWYDIRVTSNTGSVNLDWFFSKKVDDRVGLQAAGGSYASADYGGGTNISVNRPGQGAWETFNLIDPNGTTVNSGDSVYLQTDNGHFFNAQNGGGSGVDATATSPGSAQTFTIVKLNGSGPIVNGDSIALQAANGDYVTFNNGSLTCTQSAPGSSGTFTLSVDPPAAASIQSQLNSQTIILGSNGSIGVVAGGSQPCTYQWQCSTDGGSTWANLTDGGCFGGSATATLALNNVSMSMNGYQFRVIVGNPYGPSVTSNATTLDVSSNIPALPPWAIVSLVALIFLGAKATLSRKARAI